MGDTRRVTAFAQAGDGIFAVEVQEPGAQTVFVLVDVVTRRFAASEDHPSYPNDLGMHMHALLEALELEQWVRDGVDAATLALTALRR